MSKKKETKISESTGGDGFGAKKITWFGGFCLLFNNITGPGMVVLQASYQGGGWVTSTATLIVCLFFSSLASGYLIRAMAHVTGNEEFQGRVEYTPLCKAVFPRWLYLITMISFLVVLQASNVSSIVEGAQIVDLAALNIAGHNCAFQFFAGKMEDSSLNEYTHYGPIVCVEKVPNATSDGCDVVYDCVFGNNWFGISPGMVLTALVSLPMGYVNLDENIWFQVFSAVVLVLICVEWFGQFGDYTFDVSRVRPFAPSQVTVFGVILFNFQFVTTIPSWLNEKKPGVGVNSSIWWSVVISVLLYIGLGYFGAIAKGLDFTQGDALYTQLLAHPSKNRVVSIFTQAAVYMFYITLISGVPVYSIIVRYNLLQEGFPSKFWANMIAVVLPFVVAVLFYGGSAINDIMTWVGFIFTAPLNFMIPAYLYILTQRHKKTAFFALDKKFIDPALIRRRYSAPSAISPRIQHIAIDRIQKKKSRSWSGSEMEKALEDPALPDINTFIASFEADGGGKKATQNERSGLLDVELQRTTDDDYGATDFGKLSELRLSKVPYEPVPDSWPWICKSGMAWIVIIVTSIISILGLLLQLKQYVETALHPTPRCVPKNITG